MSEILIVEDDELLASNINVQIQKMGNRVLATVDNSTDALVILEKSTPDLIIMDVGIQGSYDGIELADLILEKYSIPILFITANEDELTFRRAQRLQPHAFLLKPFTGIQLQRTIQLALQSSEPDLQSNEFTAGYIEKNVLYIKKKNQIHKIQIEDIFYLEADGRYVRIFTHNNLFLVRKPLTEMTQLLPSFFVKCHKSYVVNMRKVKSLNLEDNTLLLEERIVPVSHREKDKLLKLLNWI